MELRNLRKKTIITLWSILGGLVLIFTLFMTLIFNGVIGYLPDFEQLENPVNKFASQVYSADGKLLGTWSYSSANRIFVSYDQLSPWMVKALVATEDERFYDHSGIDIKALGRAVIKRGLLGKKSAGGGSTLTQQLAKQLYSEKAENTRQRLFQKPIEWVIALKLERYYTKEEIITLYLNYFDFLHNAVGIKTAAKTYFGKEPNQLTINECALLVGMCKNPSYFNPVREPERCEERRNVVLAQMVRAGYLTEEQADSCKAEHIALNYTRQDHKEGEATYLREFLRQTLMAQRPDRSDYADWQKQQYYEDSLAWETDPLYGWCNKNTKRDGSHYNLYSDGLKIYTTIDSHMQQYAEQAVEEHVSKYLQPAFERELRSNPKAPYNANIDNAQRRKLIEKAMRQSERWVTMKAAGYSDEEIKASFQQKLEMTLYSPDGDIETTMTPYDSLLYYKKFLRSSFVCMDNLTGAVKAYVGGLNYAHFQYDMATQGKRQVGSTIKPFLYALAMESGMTPCDEAPNVQQTYMVAGQPWTPRNGSRSRYGELVTLRWGLQQSNNWISAYLINQLSPAQFVEILHQFGIKNQSIHPSLSLCLGPCDISLMEMVSAYTAFPNKGVRHTPIYVTRIEDADGNVLASLGDGLPPQSKEVISADASYRMISIMQAVMSGGTGSRMRYRYGIDAPMGGKTGTTNDNSDGWFIGYIPRLTFGAWVGGDERDIHFNNMNYAQGASAALPIAAMFLKRLFADPSLGYSPTEQFDIPEDFSECNNGLYGSITATDESGGGEEEVVE